MTSPGSVAPSPRPGRLRWRRQAHWQIAFVGTLSVTLSLVILVLGLDLLSQVRADLAETERRLDPPVEHLRQARRLNVERDLQLRQALGTDDAIRRSELVNRSAATYERQTTNISDYRRVAAGLPGEARLRTRLDQATETVVAEVTALLQGAVDDAHLGAYDQAHGTLNDTLTELTQLYNERMSSLVHEARVDADAANRIVIIASSIGFAIVVLVIALTTVTSRRRELEQQSLRERQREQTERNHLETTLQRAFEMARDEDAVAEVAAQAMQSALESRPVVLLVADSSHAHFHEFAGTGEAPGRGCNVSSPQDCPAVQHGQTLMFPTSRAIDACPHLKRSAEHPCSAVCTPLSIAGKTVGVMNAIDAEEHGPSPHAITTQELIARRTAERLSLLRAFARSEVQARTDPLTGLLNRRSLDEAVHELVEDGALGVVAFADLDQFKLLNDVHGHDTGDRALRLFARILRDSVRPGDLVARYGGEEFVIVFPSCGIDDARAVAARIRKRLADAQEGGTVPAFTVSIGLAAMSPERAFTETVERADAALLRAKAAGRDRVVVSDEADVPTRDRDLVHGVDDDLDDDLADSRPAGDREP